MTQTRTLSFIEAVFSTAIGFIVALYAQMVILPFYGLYTDFNTNIKIAVLFTAVSIVRSYFVRRLFNWWGAL